MKIYFQQSSWRGYLSQVWWTGVHRAISPRRGQPRASAGWSTPSLGEALLRVKPGAWEAPSCRWLESEHLHGLGPRSGTSQELPIIPYMTYIPQGRSFKRLHSLVRGPGSLVSHKGPLPATGSSLETKPAQVQCKPKTCLKTAFEYLQLGGKKCTVISYRLRQNTKCKETEFCHPFLICGFILSSHFSHL